MPLQPIFIPPAPPPCESGVVLRVQAHAPLWVQAPASFCPSPPTAQVLHAVVATQGQVAGHVAQLGMSHLQAEGRVRDRVRVRTSDLQVDGRARVRRVRVSHMQAEGRARVRVMVNHLQAGMEEEKEWQGQDRHVQCWLYRV